MAAGSEEARGTLLAMAAGSAEARGTPESRDQLHRSILDYLQSLSQSIADDESLEVGLQCLRESFSLPPHRGAPQEPRHDLLSIYDAGLARLRSPADHADARVDRPSSPAPSLQGAGPTGAAEPSARSESLGVASTAAPPALFTMRRATGRELLAVATASAQFPDRLAFMLNELDQVGLEPAAAAASSSSPTDDAASRSRRGAPPGDAPSSGTGSFDGALARFLDDLHGCAAPLPIPERYMARGVPCLLYTSPSPRDS